MKIEFAPSTIAMVTGASKGIGFACAQTLAKCGAQVALVARNPDTLKKACEQIQAAGGKAKAYSADLSDGQQAAMVVDQIEKEMGPIGVLVSSAGAARRRPPNELNPEAFAQGMNAKYMTGVHVMEPVIRRMSERGSGAVVNIIGQGGRSANPMHISGGAANAALMLATVGFARAAADKGVRVNGINPGLTQTGRVDEGMKAESRATGKPPEELKQAAISRIPMGRMGEPEEVAQVAAFLASDLASYVSGAIIPMDGCVASVI